MLVQTSITKEPEIAEKEVGSVGTAALNRNQPINNCCRATNASQIRLHSKALLRTNKHKIRKLYVFKGKTCQRYLIGR